MCLFDVINILHVGLCGQPFLSQTKNKNAFLMYSNSLMSSLLVAECLSCFISTEEVQWSH